MSGKRGKQPGQSNWSDTDKNRAVAVYKAVGSVGKSATITGIPERTVRAWVGTDWWDEKLKQLRAEDTAELEQAYTDISKSAAEVIKDRLTRGDFVFDKDGALVRKPVSLRDAAISGGIALSKRKELGDEPQRSNELGVSERLVKLVEQFARLANTKQIERILDRAEDKIENAIEVTEIGPENA